MNSVTETPIFRTSGWQLCSPVAWTVSAAALGYALQVNFGQFDPAAMVWLSLALAACALGAARSKCKGGQRQSTLLTILVCGLVVQFALLLIANPLATLQVTSNLTLLPFRLGIILAAALSAAAICKPSRRAIMLLVLSYLGLGLWALCVVPPPAVDVCVFQSEACRALLHGQNPYAMGFVNLYADAERVYGPGAYAGNRLLFGFPYPPLSLLLVLPGYLFGDFRISHLLAMTIAGALIATLRRSRISVAAAALFLFTPRMFFVLEAGWTEPLVVVLFTAVVFSAVRRWKVMIVLFALLLVVKQYVIVCAPIAIFLLVIPSWKAARREGQAMTPIAWVAIIFATGVTLPFALWDANAFLKSVVLLQFHQPPRMDALSYLPWLIKTVHVHAPLWIAFVAAGMVTVWQLRGGARTPGGFAGAAALLFFVFFALNKQAFCNYYLLVIAALCCAVSATSAQAQRSPEAGWQHAEREESTPAPAVALQS